MDGVNRPGSGQSVPPSDENAEKENAPEQPEHKPQTGFGERPKGMSLAERMKAKKGGITTTNGGPTVRQTPPAQENNNAAGEGGGDVGDNS